MAKFGIQHLRTANQQLVLREIYQNGPLSRAELARRTRLSRPSVSSIVRDLMTEGLVEEQGFGNSSGGKPPILLAFLDDARQVAAVDLSSDRVDGILTDLRGNIQERVRYPLDRRSGETVLQSLYAGLDALLRAGNRPLLGIGVSTPGLVDTDAGVVRYAKNLWWEDLPLAELVKTRYGVPTWVANDANLAAISELGFGKGHSGDSLVLIQAGTGVGAGLVLNGELYLGAGAAAGEIGYMNIAPFGRNVGASTSGEDSVPNLEAIAGEQALLERARSLAAAKNLQIAGDDPNSACLADWLVFEEIRAELANELAGPIGLVVGQIVNLLHPDWIVLSGNLKHLGAPFLERVRTVAAQMSPLQLRMHTKIVFSTGGDDINMRGAIALILSAALGVI
jgi:predicted NBD/HSP70 family sugar kinase